MKEQIISLIFSVFITSFLFSQENGFITDHRDGNNYQTVKIGNQWWMAENLDFYTPNSIYYDYDSISHSEMYGRLYTWIEAVNACPSGWHLSTHEDWKELEGFLGISEDVYSAIELPHTEHPYIGTNQGSMLKDTVLWKENNHENLNSTGFSAIPGGVNFGPNAGSFTNKFAELGTVAHFWASEYPRITSNAYVRSLVDDNTQIHIFDGAKTGYRSVRCVKDTVTTAFETLRTNYDFQIYPNPVSDKLFIKQLENKDIFKYSLCDLSGRIRNNGKFTERFINVSNLNNGIYILHLETDNGFYFQKKIIKK